MALDASPAPPADLNATLRKAASRALGGGIAGAAAMAIQVLTLMPLRTTMNYQYKHGMSMRGALHALRSDGGLFRFYRGLAPALVQAPLSRFGDTASNAFALTLLADVPLPVAVMTLGASLLAGAFRVLLVPVDTVKTIMQVEGAQGLAVLRSKVAAHGPSAMFHGALASAAATTAGHFPWFAVFNQLQAVVPQQDGTVARLARNAGIGFIASVCSDTVSNSLRVVKTYRQTSATPVSYPNAVRAIVAQGGVQGLLFRGLQTRILANGLQGMLFSVLWRAFEDALNARADKPSARAGVAVAGSAARGAFLPHADAAPAAVALRFSASGGYAVDVGGEPWFESGDLALAVGGAVYSLAAGGLVLRANTTGAGSDAIGTYTNTTVAWRTVGGASPGLPLATSFIVYANGAALQFAATLPQLSASPAAATLATAAPPPPPLGGLSVSFPSLQLTPWALATLQLGSVYQAPTSGNCGWTVNAAAGFPVASGALLVLEPLNASAPRASVGVAALTGQTVVRQAAVGAALALGPGAEFVLPAGYVSRALLVGVAAVSAAPPTLPPAGSAADLGFPVGGPGAALRLLGDALLAYRSKPRPAMNADSLHAGLGVSTTTFYFYNPCDCGRWANNTCPPDDGSNPGRLPNCMTYADTLERVVASWRSANIPFTHLLLDSFWYGEGVFHGGVSEWEDDPALMQQVHSFPASLAAFSDAIGRNVSIWAHNGHFVATSPYIAKYPFKGLMPQGPEMWRHLFAANAKAFNLRSIKQDHVGETIASVSPISDPGLISSWWGGMGQAAAEHNVAIEYCCSPPLVLFESLNVPAANAARSSPDYVLVGEHDTSPRTVFQWANGAEAAFHYAIGLMPDKDGFFSNSTEMQQAWKHVPPAESTPFYNYTEAGALRHATSALLCGGPVHIGDAVDATNVTLVRALMRADGLLLRASRPHAALDVQWRSMAAGAFGAPALPPARASGAPPPPPPPNSAKPDESLPNNGLGELYSTVSIVPSGPGAAACLRYTVVTSTGLARPLSLRAEDLALDSTALSAANCSANGAEGFAAFAWDLGAFTPAAAAAGGVPRRIFTGGGGAADELALAWTPAPRYADAPQMLLVAPVLQGWVVLGEVGKLLPLSPFRVASLAPAGAGAVALGLVGAVSEAVTVAACRLDAGGGAAACGGGAVAALFTCTLSSDTPLGFATLTLGADGSGVCS